MNLINELRMLAEDLHVNGYNRYSSAMSKAVDELGSLERYRTAYNEWVDKTEWVQADTSLPVKYLGMHRADVLKDMIFELKERCAKWEDVFGHLGDTPDECGNAIIAARDELEERLEAAEKERDAAELMSLALRTKVAEMERQEPVAWLHETRRDSDVVTDAVKHVWGKVAVGSMAAYSIPLYALPGAQTQGEGK